MKGKGVSVRRRDLVARPINDPANPVADCAELELSAPRNGIRSRSFLLHADVRFGQHRMTQDGVAFTVNLKRAFLKIGTKGARVAGQRAGERAAPQSRVVSTTQKRELAREATRGASAGLTLGPSATANASAQIGANAKSRFETTHTGVVSERVSHLNAHSANTWEIADTAPGENLRGLMVGHDTLCEISVDRGGYSVEGRLYCYPMDLSIDEVAFQSKGLSVLRKLSHTKNKLMAIFVSKVLGVDKSTDQIVLAKDELKEAPDEQEEGDESEGSQDIS